MRQSAAASIVATSFLGSRPRKARARDAAYTLKTEAQFRKEADQYDAAIREISSVLNMKLDADEDLGRATAIIEKAAPALKFQLSKFVVIALTDSMLINAVKKSIPDKAAADSFASQSLKDLNVILKLEGVEAVKAQLVRRSQEDRATLLKVAEQIGKGGKTGDATEAQKRAQEAATCPIAYSVVVGVVIAVISVLAAIWTGGAAPSRVGPVVEAASPAEVLRDTWVSGLYVIYGPNTSDVISERGQSIADARYARCMANAKQLPLSERTKAMALCQSAWLNEKAGWLSAA